jgi:hypothetical protein
MKILHQHLADRVTYGDQATKDIAVEFLEGGSMPSIMDRNHIGNTLLAAQKFRKITCRSVVSVNDSYVAFNNDLFDPFIGRELVKKIESPKRQLIVSDDEVVNGARNSRINPIRDKSDFVTFPGQPLDQLNDVGFRAPGPARSPAVRKQHEYVHRAGPDDADRIARFIFSRSSVWLSFSCSIFKHARQRTRDVLFFVTTDDANGKRHERTC